MNCITIWRPDPVFSRELVRDPRSRSCSNRARLERSNCSDQTSRQTMAKQGQTTTNLEGLTIAAREATNATLAGKPLPPVHLWNPPFCGDLDMRIASDGTWFYLKTPIGRHALVKLFASVLKREGEKYFLVTPVEKVGITVDDAPFTAVEMRQEGEGVARVLSFRTN